MLIKRTMSSGANDLNTVYRPCTISEVVGNDINKKIIGSCLESGSLSHSLLFTGPAGCGKTTMARIIALGLNCETVETSTDKPCLECRSCKSTLDQKNLDVVEINVGKDGGKAAVNQIVKDLSFAPMFCRYKVLIFDEAHELSKSAQDLLLKVIEDGYSHVYFIFCTNKPEKLTEAFNSRVTLMSFDRMVDDQLLNTLTNICDFEGAPYKAEVLSYIVEISNGVPRNAIKHLKQVFDEQSWDLSTIKLMLSGHALDEDDPNIMEIGKALQAGSFKTALTILSKVKAPEESIRIALAGFFTNKLKWTKSFTAGATYSAILDIITVPIHVTGKPAHHVLVNYLFKTVCIVKGQNNA
jgi:DNA polymerase III subunit gamma/tau